MEAVKDRPDDEPVRLYGQCVGVAAIWRESFAIFGDHAPLIALFALAGFAEPAIICTLVSAMLRLDFYGQASGSFATWLGISILRDDLSNPVSILVWAQAWLGLVGLAFARGAIARFALSDATDALTFAKVSREATARLPSLLIGSLGYGAVVAAGAIGVNAVLHDTDFDLSLVGQHAVTMLGHAKVLALRLLDAAVPSPDSPFAEFVPLLRHTVFEPLTRLSTYEQQWVQDHDAGNMIVGAKHSSLRWMITLASVIALILAEALLHFAPVMAMRSRERGWRQVITPVLRSVGFGIRHFGAITIHVWLLRLAFVASYSVFFMLPVVLTQDVAPAVVRGVASAVMGHWSLPLTLLCYWLVMALFKAFGTVYDARLMASLP